METILSDEKPRGARRLERRGPAWASDDVASAQTTLPEQMSKIFGYLKGMHAAHLIDIGVHLGLFAAFAKGPRRASEVAAGLGLAEEYVRIWCETACALELLDFSAEEGFRLAPHMDQILADPDGTFFVGRFPSTHFLVARDYGRYPELFRSGGVFPYQDHDDEFFAGVAAGLATLPRMFCDAVLPSLPDLERRLREGARILDVGCGGGYAIVEFAKRYPNVTCVGVDIEPSSVRLAEDLIGRSGLAGRAIARVVGEDALPEDLAGSFDLVTQFLVLHEIHPMLKDRVIAQCARALKPGGALLLFDEAYPESPAELRDPMKIYAVMAQWYEGAWGNTINTRGEIRELIARHGLRIVDETSLSRFFIVVAERP